MVKREENIFIILENKPELSSREILEEHPAEISIATLKRTLKKLTEKGLLVSTGIGRATKYKLADGYAIRKEVNMNTYFSKEIDEREIKTQFDFRLLENTLYDVDFFSLEEKAFLKNLQSQFLKNIDDLSKSEYSKELERLAIDLSWKSSQIEGNTYSLLETEMLLNEKKTATGKTQHEAIMLLNHKAAIDFIIQTPDYLNPLETRKIEDVHTILMKGLKVGRNIRRKRVGISGTNYRPLDNEFQIREALELTCELINTKTNIFEKALLAIVLLSYIQPFEDGNKRTARIVSNAILMSSGYCPLSFRTVDSIDYKKAILIFYEQNNISAFKKLFINQFEFAVNTYF